MKKVTKGWDDEAMLFAFIAGIGIGVYFTLFVIMILDLI